MLPIEQKLSRLAEVARLYYEEGCTQQEIAKKLGVSRPMISKLLADAKELGVVTIRIHTPEDMAGTLQKRLIKRFHLQSAVLVRAGKSPSVTNESIVEQAFGLLASFPQSMRVGIGWGSMMGLFAKMAEKKKTPLKGEIFPLIGGIKASYQSYHPNELARRVSESTGCNANYIYFPAIVDHEAEREVYEHTESYREMISRWESMTAAILNISNYPSSPDIATAIRFGGKLAKEKAVGSFLAHYFDRNGTIIEPTTNNILQASMEQLRRTKCVLASCNCLVRPESLLGALNTGVITHCVLSEELAVQVLSL